MSGSITLTRFDSVDAWYRRDACYGSGRAIIWLGTIPARVCCPNCGRWVAMTKRWGIAKPGLRYIRRHGYKHDAE